MKKLELKTSSGDFFLRTSGLMTDVSVCTTYEDNVITIANCNTDHIRTAFNLLGEELPKEYSSPAVDEANARLFVNSKEAIQALYEAYQFISQGANTFSNTERIELENKIKITIEKSTGLFL